MSTKPTNKPSLAYGAAVMATVAATLLRLALTPLIGGTTIPFITFFPAVLFSAWFGGFRAGLLSLVLSALAADYYFVEPVHTFAISNSVDEIALVIFVVVGFGMALLSGAQRRAALAEGLQRQQLETTLASIGDAVIATDAKGQVSFINRVAESLTGWKREEALGKTLERVFHIINEDTREPVENPALRAMQEGRIVGLANHTLLVAKDGAERPIDDAGSPIRDAEGKTIGAVLIFRDITERRRLEGVQAALLDSERAAREDERNARIAAETAELRLQLALDAGRMGTWQYSIRSGEVLWSPGLEQIHGYKPGTFPRTFDAFQDEIHPDDREYVVRAIGEAIDGKRDHHIEYRIVRKDGSIRWVEGRGRLFLDADGGPDRMVGVCADITERKHAEERFRLAVEAAPAAMIMVDPAGSIVLANALAEKLLGYERNEIVGLPVERLVPERLRSHHLEYRANYARGAKQRPMGVGRDLYVIRKDGSEVPVEIGLSPINTPDGVFVISAVTDITERKRAAEAESRARRAAEEANRAKDEFLAMLSHELRNPLNSILNWAVILRTGQMPLERVSHALEVIERNARVEAQLVESLLDLSRIAAGKLKLDTEQVDLSSVVQTVVDSLRPAADHKAITLEVTMPPAPLVVIGDSGRLQQIFSNLLTNAVKFTSRGGQIRVRVSRIGSRAQIQVIDNGEGMHADFLPHVFDRFRQAEGAKGRAHGGLGLGLAIVRELVHAHDGSVVADSPGKGKGSTFTVTLPIPAVIPTHIEAAGLLRARADEPSISGLRVLVVDDNADARELIALTLESRGAVIRLASSGAEALDFVSREKPDLMIADIGMPQVDGYALIHELRAREREQSQERLSAIALTAYATTTDRDQALAAGYDLHLTKPVGLSDLTRAVAKFRKTKEQEAVAKSPRSAR
jgi:PAS domain S-box-containing protein